MGVPEGVTQHGKPILLYLQVYRVYRQEVGVKGVGLVVVEDEGEGLGEGGGDVVVGGL